MSGAILDDVPYSRRHDFAKAAIAASRVGAAALLERRYLALLPTRIWDLLAKDYAVSCPHASSFDVAISARR